MDILEHPLEAVAFRLYSLPLPDASGATGAAAWTCLAAVLAAAAAAGLWRLRSSAPTASAAALKPLELERCNTKQALPETKASSAARSWPDLAASSTAAAAPSPKERYTAYYRGTGRVGFCDVDDDEGNDEEEVSEEDDEDGAAYQSSETTTTGSFGWEREVVRSLPLSPAAVEVGRFRSPTALGGGSIVRLWDDTGVTAASPRRRSRVVGTVAAF